MTSPLPAHAITNDKPSPHITSLPPYTPIEPFEVLSARVERKPEDIIKLDANENPYGMSPRAREALANLAYGHIYPDPESRALRRRGSAASRASLPKTCWPAPTRTN